MALARDARFIYQKVQERYGLAAKTPAGEYGSTIAKAFGYSEDELGSIPRDANLGLSCGNPFALANIREGETIIDLGSGAGFDVFLAAKKVGVKGRVYGVDMNKDMLEKANRNKEISRADNVLFIESSITDVSLPNETAHCIISNCVVNLVPEQEKQLVFNEMYRLLKAGGRTAISDILVKRDLPEELKNNMALYVGCIAGASLVQDYEKYLRNAGFADILIVDTKNDLNIYTTAKQEHKRDRCCGVDSSDPCCQKTDSCCSTAEPSSEMSIDSLDDNAENEFNEWAGSFQVYALKP